MKKLVFIAALAFALTGAAAHVSYAGTCGDSGCTPSENNNADDASKANGAGKEPCSQSSCPNDDREDRRKAAKDGAKEAARATAKAIFEAVRARNSSRHSRDEDDKQSN